MKLPKSTTSKQYPSFIRNCETLSSAGKDKVFPSFGLKNYYKVVKNTTENKKKNLLNYCKAIDAVYNFLYTDYKAQFTVELKGNKLYTLYNKNRIINNFNFINYISLREQFTFLIKRKTITSATFLNLPSYKIVFSADGNRGLWDIATMSMRGIKSCQRWTSKSHHQKLIGSMADPYAGVIYLTTDENTKYGSKMLRRAVVRIIYHKNSKDPSILIERIYPYDYQYNIPDYTSFCIFRDFLRVKNKNIPILYGQKHNYGKDLFEQADQFDINDFYIPSTSAFKKLKPEQISYRDSGITYQ